MKKNQKSNRGGRRPGAGRPKGRKDDKTIEKEKRMEELAEKYKADDPVDFMIDIMKDTEQSLGVRLDAAKSAAPYLHAKKVEQTTIDLPPHEAWLKSRQPQIPGAEEIKKSGTK